MSAQRSEIPFERACQFVIELGEAAHAYGSSSPRLEVFLSSLMASFGYSGSVLSTPNEMLFALQETNEKPQRFHMVSALSSGLDLDKLARVGELVNEVVNKKVSLENAFDKLNEIKNAPASLGIVASALAYAITGVGFAGVLGGSWWDVLVVVPLSLLVYGTVALSMRFRTTGADWMPLLSAFVVGLLVIVARQYIPSLNIVLVGISAVAVLLPGYTISIGVMDLVGGHFISGNMNIVSGMVYMVKQVAGMWLGAKLALLMISSASASAQTADPIWQWLFVPALAIGLCLAFQISKRDFVWALVACIIAFVGSLYIRTLFGVNIGNLLATIVLVIYSNNWSRITGRPTSIVLVPGIVMMVSGAIGFRGLVSIAVGQLQQGEYQLQHMFFIALTIGAGLVVGNTLSFSKATL